MSCSLKPRSARPLAACAAPLAAVILLTLVLPAPLVAQTVGALSKQQKDVREFLSEVKREMEVLSARLAESEPEDSDRLTRARARIIERLLESEMAEAEKALGEENYGRARAKIGDVLRSMKEIVAILENRAITPEELAKKLEELRKRADAVKALASEERRLRDRTKSVEEAAKDIESIGAAEREVNRLRTEQEQLAARDPAEESKSTGDAEEFESLRAEAAEQQRHLEEQAARDRVAAQLEQALSKVGELARRARDAAGNAAKRVQELGGDAARTARDAELRDIARADGVRAQDEGALAETLGDLRRQAEASKLGDAATHGAIDSAKQALEEASAAAEKSAEAHSGEPAGAARSQAAEAEALARAERGLAKALARVGAARLPPEAKALAELAKELARRFGQWAANRANTPDEASEARAGEVQEALDAAHAAQAKAAAAAQAAAAAARERGGAEAGSE